MGMSQLTSLPISSINKIAKATLHEVVPTFKDPNVINGGGMK